MTAYMDRVNDTMTKVQMRLLREVMFRSLIFEITSAVQLYSPEIVMQTTMRYIESADNFMVMF